ncbi:MAG: PepSY domain-containing protein [Pseudomonadales bacterium]
MIAFLYRWHRRLGIFLTLPILLWCLSGLAHPLMAHVATTEAARQALPTSTPTIADGYVPIQQLLLSHNIAQVDQLRLVTFNEQTWYQIQIRQPAPEISQYQEARPWPWLTMRYFSVQTGEELMNGDHQYAQWLARYFADIPDAPITQVEKLTSFDTYYAPINRLLPAYRVSFDRPDKLKVVVDTTSSRLATVSDRYRNALMWTFRTLHTWDWLGERHDPIRITVLAVLIALIFILGVCGLILYGGFVKRVKTKALKLKNMNAWHRTIGVFISLSMLGFASSGLHQLWGNYQANEFFAFTPPAAFTTAELAVNPIPQLAQRNSTNISLARLSDGVYWQYHDVTEQGKNLNYQSSISGHWLKDGDRQYAMSLAALASGVAIEKIAKTEVRQHFGRDYPGILKRLPVHKVVFKQEGLLAYYIETQTGLVANRVTGPELAKTLHFMFLHKYRFLNKVGFSVIARDLIMSVIVILIMTTACMGSLLYLRKRRGRKSQRFAVPALKES